MKQYSLPYVFGFLCIRGPARRILGYLLLVASPFGFADTLVDTEITVYDPRFEQLIDIDTQVEVLASGLGWAEGPVWIASLNALLFSDLAADKIMRWDATSGLTDYLAPSGHEPDNLGSAWRGSNGLALDHNGALIVAQQSSRRLARMLAPLDRPTPTYDVLVNEYEGQLINSPNDLVVNRSGEIYFTDPPYGHQGFENSPNIKLDFFGVFRLSADKELSVISKALEKPNGLALSTDQSTLYVSNSEPGKAQIIAIELDKQGAAKSSRLFYDAAHLVEEGPGTTDGMTLHHSDTLFVSIPNGIGVLSPQGELLGKVAIGHVTNLAFDDTYEQLFITSPNRLMRLKMNSKP